MKVASSATVNAEVCILGAGPHGLAAAIHLRRARRDLRMVVVDPAGAWLAGWHEQFARAEIETLRSPIVHHPSPDPDELSAYIDRSGLARSGLPYDLPTAEAFASFCANLVVDADLDPPLATSAVAVCPEGRGLLIATPRGLITAEHLVLATNPHRRSIPDWVWPLLGSRPGLVTYGSDVDLRLLPDLGGERVVIVGGGLTGAHLACGAAARGAEVRLVARRPLVTRAFDTDPGWLGPKYLHAFGQDGDPASRLRTALAARGGGTVPPWMRDQIDAHMGEDRLVVHEGCAVRAAGVDRDGRYVLALDDHATLEADRVWLATGTTPDIDAFRYLANLAPDVPAVHGVPITDDGLRLGPHPVHVMGRMATLTLGPAAGNLWGAQRAASRITKAITGVDLEGHTNVAPPPPSRPAPEGSHP